MPGIRGALPRPPRAKKSVALPGFPCGSGNPAAAGYTGFVGQEFVPKGNPVRALERAFEICNV